MMRYAIGLDVGSTTIKGGLLDLHDMAVQATAHRLFPPAAADLQAGRHEVDAEDVVARCRDVIDELSRGALPEAVLICGQHGGYVPFDPDKRRAIGPFISWRDERTAERDPQDAEGSSIFERLRRDIGSRHLAAIGREFAPGERWRFSDGWIATRFYLTTPSRWESANMLWQDWPKPNR